MPEAIIKFGLKDHDIAHKEALFTLVIRHFNFDLLTSCLSAKLPSY